MNEIAPGIYHWTARHPDIHARVSSYYVQPAGIVIDPLEPEDGMGFFDELDLPPQQVVLTSGLHWRHSDRFRDRYDATIRVVSSGVPRWDGTGREAETFEYGDEVAPGVRALEVGQICPDDTALHIAHGNGAISFADGLISHEGVPTFVPDSLMEDAEETKEGLRNSLRGLLEKDFDTLLFAHGDPLEKGGFAALKNFLA
jgi:hypothetical protein